MDAESLRLSVEHAGIAAAGLAFLAGLVFSFNPVALASIPVSLAYVTRGRDQSQAVLFGAMFVLGMILTHVILGFSWIGWRTGRGHRWKRLGTVPRAAPDCARSDMGRLASHPAAITRFPCEPSHLRLGCIPSRDSIRSRRVPRMHSRTICIAWRNGGNWFDFAWRAEISQPPAPARARFDRRREIHRRTEGQSGSAAAGTTTDEVVFRLRAGAIRRPGRCYMSGARLGSASLP
jgi:hypothetical protein